MNREISQNFSKLLPTAKQFQEMIDKMKTAMEVPDNGAMLRVQLAVLDKDKRQMEIKIASMKAKVEL